MIVSALIWYAWVQLIFLAVLPLALRVFGPLPDRGYGLAKILGILVWGYLAWALGMLGLLEHTRPALVACAAGLAAACWLGLRKPGPSALPSRGVVLGYELLFLSFTAAGVVVRAYAPDIFGQEKFMDFALMNAFIAADRLPAEDPWLAGYGVPYYYLAYFLLASLTEVGGLEPSVGYNLGLVLVESLLLLGSACLVFNVARMTSPKLPSAAALGWGALASIVVGVLGNLEAIFELVAIRGQGTLELWQTLNVRGLGPQAAGQDFNWFRAARVIPNIQPDGISEFPYFSFLLGDLHPHFMALPLDLLVLALALTVLVAGPAHFSLAPAATAALALGGLVAASTWDIATFWLAFAAAFLAAALLDRRADTRPGAWREPMALLGFIFVGAIVMVAPYFVGYVSQPLGIGIVRERTPLVSVLILFGPLLALCLVWIACGWLAGWGRVGWRAVRGALGAPWAAATAGLTLVVLAIQVVMGEATLAVLTLLLAALAPVGAGLIAGAAPAAMAPPAGTTVTLGAPRPGPGLGQMQVGGLRFTWLVIALGLAVMLGAEVLYISDSFQTRMNTVFKFQYHAWLLLGIGGSLGLFAMAHHMRPRAVGVACSTLLAGLTLAAGSAYPVAATYARTGGFGSPPTLSGERFLERAHPDDHAAIRWLRQQPKGGALVEAVGPDYQEFARVSTFSGHPALLGWVGHELQWRGQHPELGRRQSEVDRIYGQLTQEGLRQAMRNYGIRYVFFGDLELQKYGPEAARRLDEALSPAFVQGLATVYVLPAGPRPAFEPVLTRQ